MTTAPIEKTEVRFFQANPNDIERRRTRMEIHARLHDGPVTVVTSLADKELWEQNVAGTNIKVTTALRTRNKKLRGLVLVDALDKEGLIDMHKQVIQLGAAFEVVDIRNC